MTNNWKIIIVHLRQELVDYGALLGLYDEQQRALFARQPDTVLPFTHLPCPAAARTPRPTFAR